MVFGHIYSRGARSTSVPAGGPSHSGSVIGEQHFRKLDSVLKAIQGSDVPKKGQSLLHGKSEIALI